ncbi:MAG TPA: ComEA family DNA-binding protein [Candidatus Limnocylindrales bacterium]|nr:ComEA family DNA-binding protein [Candidatus Limnocylindrales bacterium]
MDQLTPAWRVFDEPGTAGGGSAAVGGAASATGGGPPVTSVALASPNVLVAVAALVGALVIGGVALVIALSGSAGSTVEGPGPAGGSAVESGDPTGIVGDIVVDVAGAVVTPGLYHLATGTRVGDAIDAAGGFGPRVDVDRVGRELNLAAALADGDQVRVPSRDDPSAAPGGGSGGGSGSGSGGSARGSGNLLDLNTATQAELEELPGIGPVTAEKIMAARDEAPFRSADDLRQRGLVGEKTFEDIKALVTAG